MPQLDLTLVMMLVVARRIARTNRDNPQKAQAEYKAHTSAMSPGDIETFKQMYLDSIIEVSESLPFHPLSNLGDKSRA